MEVPRTAANGRPDDLMARLVAITIHELTACISYWRDYAASKDAQIQQMHKDCQQLKARNAAQSHTIKAQAERIRCLEFEVSPMELSCNTLSPAAFSMSLQESRRKMSGSAVDLQPSFGDGTFDNAMQETYCHSPDDDELSLDCDALAPLMALATTAVEGVIEQRAGAEEATQSEGLSPEKRRLEEADVISKRARHV